MVDTPGTLAVAINGTILAIADVMFDGSGNFIPQNALRNDGAPVSTANPLPVTDPLALINTGSIVALLAGGITVKQPDVRATGQALASASLNAAITVALNNGEGVVSWVVSGLTASGAILTSEYSNDGSTWSPHNLLGNPFTSTITADGQYRCNGGGHAAVRLRVSTIGTGNITVAYNASSASSIVDLGAALPAGSNAIGSVSQTPSALTNSAFGNAGTAAAIAVPFSSTRKWLMFSNRTAGAETHDIGSSNVTVNGGIPVAPGAGFLFTGPGAAGPIYAVTTVGSSPFSYVEA